VLFSAVAVDSPIQFGPYLLTERVGQGGMAVVYKATRKGPSGFAKTVVVKAMLPALSSQREFVAMFSAEARLMAAMAHPNVVQVQDFGVVDSVPYLVMEYLAGRNLAQLRGALAEAKMKLPIGAALTIAREMCHGLGFAHNFVDDEGKRRRVIHRDVSPSNVMVCRDGSVKLLDFGVAKIVGEFEFDVTQSFKGKYAYMAPEQVGHQPIDCRIDVFAAGVVLHELLTGKRLFAANTELETLQRVSLAQVIAPSIDNREVPRALDAIVKKALARHPGDRYSSGDELAEALETLDALAWPRKRLAALMDELFAREWMVVCEVCGKGVLPGAECQECGTAAPDASAAEELAPELSSAVAPVAPLPGGATERNPIADSQLPALPVSGSEPLPLPPPPPTPPAPRRAPKLLPNDAPPRRRLQVVRTPVPPPILPGRTTIDAGAAQQASGQIDTDTNDTDKDVKLPPPVPPPSAPATSTTATSVATSAAATSVTTSAPAASAAATSATTSTAATSATTSAAATSVTSNSPATSAAASALAMSALATNAPLMSASAMSPPKPGPPPLSAPPRLYVVPRPEPTPLPPRPRFDVLAVPRPAAKATPPSPRPSVTLTVPPLPTLPLVQQPVRRSSSAPLIIVGLVLLAGVLFAVFAAVSRPPRPEPIVGERAPVVEELAATAAPTSPASQPTVAAPTSTRENNGAVPTTTAHELAVPTTTARELAVPTTTARELAVPTTTAHELAVPTTTAHELTVVRPTSPASKPADVEPMPSAAAEPTPSAPADAEPMLPPSNAATSPASASKPARVPPRRRASHASHTAAVEERSVKDGRIVDPFAELK
jgi:serine/threonine-protein kinase